MKKKKHLSVLACGLLVATLGASWLGVINVHAQDSTVNAASFNSDGSVNQPEGWRRWVFVGSPLTPNALNGGHAAFPEFHNVYVESSAFNVYETTGEWPEGTQIVKELTSIYENNNDEVGASMEVSGRGFQQGEFQGLELTVKDSSRFSDMAGGWAYFSFGHKPQPYEKTAMAFPEAACNACHAANAKDDFVFTQFYPVLRAAKNSK
ncbi:MAG: hypothetical protein ACI9UN_001810 [Granulosicoccus sp.]|jgi:hypothetical protein